MDVLEKAKELAEAIQQDERCKRYQLAKAANDADAELQSMIGQFNLIKLNLSVEMRKEDKDQQKVDQLQEELKKVYGNIMKTPQMTEYESAKGEVDELVSHINSMIQMSISGEVDSQGCQGNCSGCQGCH